MKFSYSKVKLWYNWGGRYLTNAFILDTQQKNEAEVAKTPTRTDILNYLLHSLNRPTTYLEIGVRRPSDNFDQIQAEKKYSVDPGVEFNENPVDFKLTSDAFFEQLKAGQVLSKDIQFDVIFIDGLHLADQVDRDIENALQFLKKDGFVVLHDCNPPTEWHAREEFYFDLTPARNYWNGTTWKAFFKYRFNPNFSSACIDTDWGVGIISRNMIFNNLKRNENPFFEYKVLDKNRCEHLNLIDFNTLKTLSTPPHV